MKKLILVLLLVFPLLSFAEVNVCARDEALYIKSIQLFTNSKRLYEKYELLYAKGKISEEKVYEALLTMNYAADLVVVAQQKYYTCRRSMVIL